MYVFEVARFQLTVGIIEECRKPSSSAKLEGAYSAGVNLRGGRGTGNKKQQVGGIDDGDHECGVGIQVRLEEGKQCK